VRLVLVRHPGTADTRSAAVPDDEPAIQPLPDLAPLLGRDGRLLRSPARRCEAPGAQVDERLRPWDLGAWTGRPFAELDLTGWRVDPAYADHGGESLLALHHRVAVMLDQLQDGALVGRSTVVGITHGSLIKAAVVTALGAHVSAVWDLDVNPASMTELSATHEGWRVVRVNARYP
jgi:broad specificity phosphatase PhoE